MDCSVADVPPTRLMVNLGQAGALGQTAILADTAGALGGQAIDAVSNLLDDPVKLAIITAVLAGFFVLSRK